MKIGKLVQRHVPAIVEYCETRDAREFHRLQDREYSKKTLDINYPFCRPVGKISQNDCVRYWREEYEVHGTWVRVTSQWFNPPTSNSLPLFRRYLNQRGIEVQDCMVPDPGTTDGIMMERTTRAARGRYKGNAIGNAQNLLVRNLLSRLGDEHFGESEWRQVIAEFNGRCAYCGAQGELMMDHVVPINKQSLGEHRLGNLVPSCRTCNAKKGDGDYRDFLSHAPGRIAVIDAHMVRFDYAPIKSNPKVRQVIELAHQDVRQLAERYVAILNAMMAEGGE